MSPLATARLGFRGLNRAALAEAGLVPPRLAVATAHDLAVGRREAGERPCFPVAPAIYEAAELVAVAAAAAAVVTAAAPAVAAVVTAAGSSAARVGVA